ncbi:MAG TPA: HAMP domain-containing sensor histidine kinase [Thermoanaerobaculia bacterium]|nr:HAMP domain-containing sensor histidine kinase [Thermoanaerobaculia bacterium]
MLRNFIARLKAASHRGDGRESAPVLLPFIIISVGLAVLAWRSYTLSLRMEHGANTLAVQYAGYAAEITARRVDTAIRAELFRASEDWQQTERRSPAPTFEALQQWINANEWIVSVIYVPDADPINSIYVSELTSKKENAQKLTREFYTSSGTVRYTYDPDRLLARVRPTINQQPLVSVESPDMLSFQQRANVTLTRYAPAGRSFINGGFAFSSPLAAPLNNYSIRAVVRPSYVGSGWENQRVISVWLSVLAFTFTAGGALMATRGLRKERETMRLRGALIANVSHELRTPLSMIRLGAETLKRGAKLKEKERLDIEDQILREVLHLSHLVENVLDVARIQHNAARAMAFTPVHPRELITMLISTYESWIRSKGFAVSMQIDDTVEAQYWDRESVSRALLNLVDNAIKYSGDDKRLEVILRQDAEHVIVDVHDHGIGIGPGDLQRIFDPYFRAQFSDTQTRRGAGLGLTLVQQIVAAHGGRVEVESELGKGSTFRLLFPRLKPEEAGAMAGLIHAKEAF